MNRCASVRKKGSKDQCLALALKGHSMCGRHARMKTPQIWASLHRTTRLPTVQALVRGWLLRRRLALAGPGVLRRTALANDEDVFTCESKDRQHPLEYFAFEESGKVWWFDAKSLWAWVARSAEPVNPYTKVPLTPDTRRRLRAYWAYTYRTVRPLPVEKGTFEQLLSYRWNVLTQVFRDNGFVDVSPHSFRTFSRQELLSMFVLLHQDLLVVLPERDMYRERLLRLARRGMTVRPETTPQQYLLHAAWLLELMVMIPRDPYVVVFSILSAFYRC